MSTANTNQKENTMPYEHLVKCPSPPYSLFGVEKFHYVPRSTEPIVEFTKGYFTIGADTHRSVGASLHTNPEELVQMASDALLLAEHLRERQSAVQAEKEAEKDAQELDKEAQALYASTPRMCSWNALGAGVKDSYRTMARKAREIHGVSK